MSLDLFRILDDLKINDRWFLNCPIDTQKKELDPRDFICSRSFKWTTPLRITVQQSGISLDWTFAAFDMPVVSERLAVALVGVAGNEVQLIPARVDGVKERFFVLNALSSVVCLNEEKSVYKWWTEADGRPDKVGKYRGVNPIVLHADRAQGHNIFRIDGWKIALIVSEEIRDVFQRLEATGATFKRVAAE